MNRNKIRSNTPELRFMAVLILLFFSMQIVYSYQEHLPNPIPRGSCGNLTQDCAYCDYVTLKSIDGPGVNFIINENMTEVVDGKFYYTFCNTSIVGDYSYSTAWGNYSSPVSFIVNSNGESSNTQKSIVQTLLIPSLGAILALILIAISFIFMNETAAKSLRYSGIIVASLTLYLCFLLEANDLLSILNAGMIAVGVGSLFEVD